jgi:hypothetical protein
MNAEVTMPSFVTLTGLSRETRMCVTTLRRRIELGQIAPDAVLVEGAVRPGSLLFREDSLPSIAAKLATKPTKP